MKITKLAEPKTLRVMCQPDEHHEAMIALVKEAKKQGISPAVIAVTKVEDVFDIILWGD